MNGIVLMPRRRKLLRLAMTMFAFLVISIGADPAKAQVCTTSYSNFNFGTVDLTTGAGYPTSATSTVSCSGTANQVIYVCGGVNTADPFYIGPVKFSLFQDASGLSPWTGNGSLKIGLNGTASLNQTVYARLAGGQMQTAPGSYQTGGAAIALSSYGLTSVCGTAMTAQVPAQLIYPASCRISAQDLTFSPGGLLTTVTDASSIISATCSFSSPYDVLLDGGQSVATNPTQRKLTFGGNEIVYGLYQDAAYSLPWGSTIGSNTVAGSGTGQTQSLRVYGRIPKQATPPPGTYQDRIIVTISY